MAAKLRTQIGGKLRIEPTGLLPVDPETGRALQPASPTTGGSAWRCSTRSSRWSTTTSATCSRTQHPDWTDDQLFRKARLINSALMAKIHTVEWTPAIVPHPIIKTAMNVNWSGLAGEDLQELARVPRRQASCSAASSARTPTITRAPYSLTEEFVAVYRMHPLMPDEFAFHSAVTGRLLEKRQLDEIAGAPDAGDRRAPDDAGPVLLVRHVPSGRGDAAQLPAPPAEPHAGRRRAPRPGGGGHPARPRARRAALQPVPPPAAQGRR